MERIYDDIVEVVQTGTRAARQFMDHGYFLLHIEGVTKSARHPLAVEGTLNPQVSNAGGYYVRRDVQYVLGRTALTPKYSPFADTEPATPAAAE